MPDTEIGKGPTKVVIDDMYLHGRVGRYRGSVYNPPHMVMVEHKHGRCWAYRVPNKVVLEDAYWLPERMVKDLDDSAMRYERYK